MSVAELQPATSSIPMMPLEVPVIEATVVVVQSGVDAFGQPTYCATTEPSVMQCDLSSLYEIRWTIDNAQLPEGTVAVFDPIAVTFANNSAPALFIQPDAGATTARAAFWSNINTAAQTSYRYTVHLNVNGVAVSHDPTVENIPPG